MVCEAVWQPGGVCIPLFRPHCHPWVPPGTLAAGAGRVLLSAGGRAPPVTKGLVSGRTGDYQSLGGGLRPQSRAAHRVGPKRGAQRGVCAALAALDGAARALWRVLHLQEHGARALPRVQHEVVVVPHQAVGQGLGIEARECLPHDLQHSLPVLVIHEDVLAPVTTGSDGIDDAREFDAQWASRGACLRPAWAKDKAWPHPCSRLHCAVLAHRTTQGHYIPQPRSLDREARRDHPPTGNSIEIQTPCPLIAQTVEWQCPTWNSNTPF